MTIWAIADIHASPLDESGRPQKPMEVFGSNWAGHVDRLDEAWNRLVAPDDTVIVAGDLDWSLHLADAIPTLRRIGSWSGRKILIRGNHDFWWSSGATSKVRAVVPESIRLLHNDAWEVEGFNIVGCKGSPVPGGPEWTEVEAKLLNRESERLKLSMSNRNVGLPSIAALHYPPCFRSSGSTPYTDLFRTHQVRLCVYGHLHGTSARLGVDGEYQGIQYRLVAADHLDFTPVPIASDGGLCR